MEGFMPPLLGTREIANFAVSSFPGLGTLLISLYGAVVVGAALHQIARLRERAPERPMAAAR
jgi:hypothetical protein